MTNTIRPWQESHPHEPIAEGSPYVAALQWAAAHIYPGLDIETWNALYRAARSLPMSEIEKRHTCLLEFHHDGSNRVDASFQVTENPSSGEFSQPQSDRQGIEVAGQDTCFFEFDSGESGAQLAGIFQDVNRSGSNNRLDPETSLGIFQNYLSRQGCQELTEQSASYLRDIFATLGCPFSIGQMIGRPDDIKLIFTHRVAADGLAEIPQRWFSPEFATQYTETGKRVSAIRSSFTRTCLDLQLNQVDSHPRLCIEVFPNDFIRESKDWEVLKDLQREFHIRSEQCEEIRWRHMNVPSGEKFSPFAGILNPHFGGIERIYTMLSHYKICPSEKPSRRIKSYIYVFAEKRCETRAKQS